MLDSVTTPTAPRITARPPNVLNALHAIRIVTICCGVISSNMPTPENPKIPVTMTAIKAIGEASSASAGSRKRDELRVWMPILFSPFVEAYRDD
jgi:hypothetical protein